MYVYINAALSRMLERERAGLVMGNGCRAITLCATSPNSDWT